MVDDKGNDVARSVGGQAWLPLHQCVSVFSVVSLHYFAGKPLACTIVGITVPRRRALALLTQHFHGEAPLKMLRVAFEDMQAVVTSVKTTVKSDMYIILRGARAGRGRREAGGK